MQQKMQHYFTEVPESETTENAEEVRFEMITNELFPEMNKIKCTHTLKVQNL